MICHYWMLRCMVYVLMISVFVSCSKQSDKAPGGILSKDKMIAVLFDIHVAESSVNSRGLTNLELNKLVAVKYEDIMKKHRTTYAIFKESFDYYLHRPEQFELIYQEIVNQLTAMEGKAKAGQPERTKDGVDTLRRN